MERLLLLIWLLLHHFIPADCASLAVHCGNSHQRTATTKCPCKAECPESTPRCNDLCIGPIKCSSDNQSYSVPNKPSNLSENCTDRCFFKECQPNDLIVDNRIDNQTSSIPSQVRCSRMSESNLLCNRTKFPNDNNSSFVVRNHLQVPMIVLNLSTNIENPKARLAIVNVFKGILVQAFKQNQIKLEVINVTSMNDCVQVLFPLPKNGSISDALKIVKSIDSLPEGLRLATASALVQKSQFRSKDNEDGLVIRAPVFLLVLLMLVFMILSIVTIIRRTQPIANNSKFDKKENQNASNLQSQRRKIYLMLTSKTFSDYDKSIQLSRILECPQENPDWRVVLNVLSSLDDSTSESALHLAVRLGLFNCTSYLLSKYSVLAKCLDSGGRTIIHTVVRSKCPAMLQVILNHRLEHVDLDSSDNEGRTPLQLCVLLNMVSMGRMLLCRGVIVDLVTRSLCGMERSVSALHLAAEMNAVEEMKLLLSFAANVNVPNDREETPLIFAIQRDNYSAAQLLISRGAMLNITTSMNETPISLALKRSHSMLSLVSCALFAEQFVRQAKEERINARKRSRQSQEAKRSNIPLKGDVYNESNCIDPARYSFDPPMTKYANRFPTPQYAPICPPRNQIMYESAYCNKSNGSSQDSLYAPARTTNNGGLSSPEQFVPIFQEMDVHSAKENYNYGNESASFSQISTSSPLPSYLSIPMMENDQHFYQQPVNPTMYEDSHNQPQSHPSSFILPSEPMQLYIPNQRRYSPSEGYATMILTPSAVQYPNLFQ
ncbi:hypothetical protein ACOME3_003368 [Neoechinorhynchus agilis]